MIGIDYMAENKPLGGGRDRIVMRASCRTCPRRPRHGVLDRLVPRTADGSCAAEAAEAGAAHSAGTAACGPTAEAGAAQGTRDRA